MDQCDRAREQGVEVFTIAFEISQDELEEVPAAIASMQYCASTAGHFYNVSGLEITEAFESIASSIGNLKLTH